MSKTAIQEMMSEIQANYPQLFDVYTQLGRSFVNDMHKYLAMEKEQIINAIELTIEREYSERTWANCASVNIMAEQYYHEIYGTDSN